MNEIIFWVYAISAIISVLHSGLHITEIEIELRQLAAKDNVHLTNREVSAHAIIGAILTAITPAYNTLASIMIVFTVIKSNKS